MKNPPDSGGHAERVPKILSSNMDRYEGGTSYLTGGMSEGPCLHREGFPTYFRPPLIPMDDHPVFINLEGLGRRLEQFVHLTRKYLIDSVLRTYMNHVEIEEGSV